MNINNINTTLKSQIMKISKKLYIFHSLPRVEKCLCCMDNRLGCIIISFIYLYLTVDPLVSIVSGTNGQCYIKGLCQQIISLVTLIVWSITLVSTLLFVYGITKEKPAYILVFIYATVLLIAFNMVQSFLMFFHFYKVDRCPSPYLYGGANFIGAVVLMYFLVIVNSYYLQIVEKQNLNIGVILEPSILPSVTPSRVSSSSPSAIASATKKTTTSWF